ncbi:DUF2887 domain-containing protein [Nostoc sp. DedVER01b]|uniref:DUF2887 domain-containing protein n=1 Tax=Nostoc sp. DedVER01b TaxID=3075404 RepID=UPI002AD39CF5|nr:MULTISPECIES: DUF2887 domain-containing protein [unclassified Nostoc]MDZ7986569.1 DUF2887 domain-containing protein [Nostoc sp. DedVER02]MDZ8113956.1 DUF2887 domain-containing protein [Nostoc sp. DedVER01b]
MLTYIILIVIKIVTTRSSLCKIYSSTVKQAPLKTDSIFYQIFQSIPSTFFELINQPPQ